MRGPVRYGDGSFHFKIAVHEAATIAGDQSIWVADADIDVQDGHCALALAEALRQIADQLPPPIITQGN
jgi:hypothetical protein